MIYFYIFFVICFILCLFVPRTFYISNYVMNMFKHDELDVLNSYTLE